MIHPKHDRIDYGEQLIPPVGYDLDYAVCTTYSLDLEALMMLPVSLFYSKSLEGKPDELRYDVLDSITKAADKIKVYYHNGQLKVPSKYHPVIAWWEKGIVPVTMPQANQSFHPKVWIARYRSEGKPVTYRLLVTSRNLTFTRDWDIAFSSEGTVTENEQPRNLPLIHFLEYMNAQSPQIPAIFMAELSNVEFESPSGFRGIDFLPIGIPNPTNGLTYTNPLTKEKGRWKEMLIVSPFLQKATLDNLKGRSNQKPFLLSRSEELDKLDTDTLASFECYGFNPYLTKAEYIQELEEDGAVPQVQNLHAKLYVFMDGSQPVWFLGSANCSEPAQQRNVEFMVRMRGRNKPGIKANEVISSLTSSDTNDKIPLFVPYTGNDDQEGLDEFNHDFAIRQLKHSLATTEIKGFPLQTDGTITYNLRIEVDCTTLTLPEGYAVFVRPLPEDKENPERLNPASINVIERFGGYSEIRLSPFLVFSIQFNDLVISEFLLTMDIELPKGRLNRIFSSIIDSRDKFMKYLSFLLTGEETALINEKMDGHQGSGSNNNNNFSSLDGGSVYEKLLLASSRQPEKIKSIDNLIQKLQAEIDEPDNPIITEEFASFWSTFKEFTKNRK